MWVIWEKGACEIDHKILYRWNLPSVPRHDSLKEPTSTEERREVGLGGKRLTTKSCSLKVVLCTTHVTAHLVRTPTCMWLV